MAGRYQKFYMKESLAAALNRYCARTNRSAHAVARQALEEYLSRQEAEKVAK